MFVLRVIEFSLQVCITIFIVLILQISIKGKTLEQHLLSYIHVAEELEDVREVTQAISTSIKQGLSDKIEASSSRKTPPKKVQIDSKRSPASNETAPNSMKAALNQVLPKINKKLRVFSKIVPDHLLETEFKKIEDKTQKIPPKNPQ